MSLAGRHAIVTGGGSGIGAATATELARLGARLTLIGRRAGPLAKTCAALAGEHFYQVANVTLPDSVAAAFAAAVERSGPVAILVNNAGAAESAPFLKTDLALLERMMSVNLNAAFLCAQAVLPAMLQARQGAIVNVASTAGVTGYAYVAAYCAAKHALVGMTRALAREVAAKGITVNAVCPGYTDTELVARAVENITAKTGRAADDARADLASSNPMGRLVTPAEVAATIGFLCSPGAASITGQAIVVAGGEIMT